MRRHALIAIALLMPVLAQAQSNPGTGFSSGVVHGQRPDMRQDLHNAPGAAAAAGGPQAPQTRTQQIRQRSQTAQQQQRATQQQRSAQQRRATQHQREAQQGQATRTQRTGAGTPAARTPDSIAAQEARMADARRRQATEQRRAADRQDGVALGTRPLGQ